MFFLPEVKMEMISNFDLFVHLLNGYLHEILSYETFISFIPFILESKKFKIFVS